MEQESGMHTCTVGPVRVSVWHARFISVTTVAGVAGKKECRQLLERGFGRPVPRADLLDALGRGLLLDGRRARLAASADPISTALATLRSSLASH